MSVRMDTRVSASRGRSGDVASYRSQPSGRSLVESPSYRESNLQVNGIVLQHPCDPLPRSVAGLVADMQRGRSSPEPSPESVLQDRSLHNLAYFGACESEVEKHFQQHMFPNPREGDVLLRLDKQVMARSAVPLGNAYGRSLGLKISTPIPDSMFGYSKAGVAVHSHQRLELIDLDSDLVANNQNLQILCPFLIIEYKGEGGSLWAATNQCLGGASTCVNIIERLNNRLMACTAVRPRLMDSTAFSIAIDPSGAHVYVTWYNDDTSAVNNHDHQGAFEVEGGGSFCTAELGFFNLRNASKHLLFRRYVRNIIEWGRTHRLAALRGALDTLAEERRLQAAAAQARKGSKRGGEPSTGRRSKR